MSAVQPTCPKLTHSINLTSFSLQLHRFTAGRSVRGEHAWSSDSFSKQTWWSRSEFTGSAASDGSATDAKLGVVSTR